MIIELALILAGAGATGYFVARRRRERRADAAKTKGPRPGEEVRVGDALLYMGADFVVSGELCFTEEATVFHLFSITDGRRDRWLLVEPGQPQVRSLLDETTALTTSGALPEIVPLHGISHRMRRRGAAQASSQGELARLSPGKFEYYRYSAPGRQVLLLLRQKDETLALAGEEMMPGTLEILPGQS